MYVGRLKQAKFLLIFCILCRKNASMWGRGWSLEVVGEKFVCDKEQWKESKPHWMYFSKASNTRQSSLCAAAAMKVYWNQWKEKRVKRNFQWNFKLFMCLKKCSMQCTWVKSWVEQISFHSHSSALSHHDVFSHFFENIFALCSPSSLLEWTRNKGSVSSAQGNLQQRKGRWKQEKSFFEKWTIFSERIVQFKSPDKRVGDSWVFLMQKVSSLF